MIKKIKKSVYAFLRYSEKYTRTDMVYLAKGGFWVTSSNVFLAVMVFITTLAFANLLPKEIFGQYKYALSVFAILKIFTLPGMNTATMRAIVQGNEGTILRSIKSKISWGVIGTIFGFILAAYYCIQGNFSLAAVFITIGFFVPIFDTFSLYNAYFVGKKLFSIQAKFSIFLESITSLILIFSLLLLLK